MTVRDDLLRLVPPPGGAETDVDWSQVEDALGVTLPGDYKWLVERYGPGSFNDFLYILQPSSPFHPTRLVESANRAAEILDELRESGVGIPYEVDELLPVGKTDNGDIVYWVTRPEDAPDSWTIVANGARNLKWPHFDGGIVEFLVAVLSGAHRVDVFPGDFIRDEPVFEGYPAPDARRRR
ncbi:SMI1/KNR4 family protein [Streptomyces sp. BV286]|uniref:SMI1/KNR4 family protein n=1 Tax=Streptomyces sp. BV286 TaxID=2849672 RepID=UPI001C2E041A|nr:SMI1/KNR4 family protein [Streptomyces sp. BV286]MBV1938361.1 SMI1/KNR4 family protein [Streptomyces sp. BV286]